MGPIMVPAVGLVFWLVHMAFYLSGRRLGWPFWACFWAWLAGLPAAVVFCLFYWSHFVPHPAPEVLFDFSTADNFWLTNATLGLAVWVAFLVIEPLLIFADRLVRRCLGNITPPNRPE
ncbi:hypothetical protein [Parafrankia sp. EUN1f]|uniref:hypothetical protein n=1 Tax=Parafrankia sp. EUN1f TaxID=102897 RepID=UPI0001C4741B|nr:hypothetical protein [Parafrankia sp. EUN1f]EFC86319.1 hypothetical protein FrEUN1fDRAFT_0589 [Parafrankia sp. EUN1f]